MTSACATLTSNVPAQSGVFLKPVVSLQVVLCKIDSLYRVRVAQKLTFCI